MPDHAAGDEQQIAIGVGAEGEGADRWPQAEDVADPDAAYQRGADRSAVACLDVQLENAIGTDHSEVKSPSLPADPSASIPSYPK